MQIYNIKYLNNIKLKALYCMLSAKLAEGKLRVIDTEKVDLPKT